MRQRALRILTPVLFVLAFLVPASAQLTTQPIVEGVTGVVAFVQDPVLPNTFYLVRQSGAILIFQNGSVLPTPLLDLTGQLTSGGERGLLGMAFAPKSETGWFFINFTNADGDTVIARFTRQAGAAAIVDGSRRDLRWPDGRTFIEQPAANNHKGGQLAFGDDGYLYIGLGDGGGGNDTFDNAQNPLSLLGKMLRLDIDVSPGDTKGYRVPTDNPFVGFSTTIVHHEIWAFGLRNPWRYSVDNPRLGGTGALIVGDVGQSAREEVNYEPNGAGGRNYGWPNREGTIATPGVPPSHPTVPIPLTNPLVDYPRAIGTTVVGGYVYRGSELPASFRGRYFLADFGSGLVASIGLAINPQSDEATLADVLDHTAALGGDGIVSFAEDLNGELYIVRAFAGPAVSKIVAVGAPTAPQSLTGNVAGTTVSLDWTPPSSGTPSQYQLEVGSASDDANLLVLRLPGTQTSLGAPNIANGRYFVRVRAVAGGLVGPPSEEVSLLVGCEAPPPVPGAISGPTAPSGSTVTLAWGASAGATQYTLFAQLPTGAIVSFVLNGSRTSVSTSVPPGTYRVAIAAQNACGSSALTSPFTFVVQ